MAESCRFDSFARLPDPWKQLVTEAAATFDQTLPWFLAFERHLLERDQRLLLLGVTDAHARPAALLPLRTDRVPLVGTWRAAALTSLSNYYTALYAPLAVATGSAATWVDLAQAVVAARAGSALIDLNPVDAEAAATGALAQEWGRHGYRVERYLRFGNWYLEVGGRSSDDYLAGLPGQLRSTLQRKGKKLRSQADVAIRIVRDPLEVPAAMEAYEAVYRSSWKTDEPGKEFIRTVAGEFAARGWLRLGLVTIGGQPVAAQIWFVYRRTASIFKLAYDEKFTHLSVGSALTWALMQHVLDIDTVTTVDYLCGDDAYKRDWMSARRERIGLRAVRRASWPGAVAALAGIARRLRRAAPARK